MRKSLLVLCCVVLFAPLSARAAEPIRAMILTGEQGGPYHAWGQTTPYLWRMLEETGLFRVDVVVAPPAGGDFANFKPVWENYQVIVSNYDVPDERWSDELKASFDEYMRNGGGLVSYHAADNAFPHWKEYNLMIGIGGWRGRDETSGPMWYFKDGKLISDDSPGRAGSHGARKLIKMVNRAPEHPIMKGLPEVFMHVADELYATLRGPGKNMEVLATAWSDPSNRGTNHDEPLLMALHYGKGRIFHTALGHDLAAMNCVAFITTLQRGTEWAATGEVTQKVPEDFPTADKTSTRQAYEPPPGWVSPTGRPGPPTRPSQ